MAEVESFAPLVGRDPRILILGSMPGKASLAAVQYYAHPRNAFWPIMTELFALEPAASYQTRIQQIAKTPVILWDTLKRCWRAGSLDANIERESVEANEIPELLQQYSLIRVIAFNGATSAKYFDKLVKPRLPSVRSIELLPLPSTSPANAAMSFEQKLKAWRRLLAFVD